VIAAAAELLISTKAGIDKALLAERHAASWSRKISVTSSAERDMPAGVYAGGGLPYAC
jgi:hypothetical protein